MKSKLFMMMVVFGILSGCAANLTPQWYKEGVSRHETRNKISQCEYDINMARDMTPEKQQALLRSCMMKDGYRWVKR